MLELFHEIRQHRAIGEAHSAAREAAGRVLSAEQQVEYGTSHFVAVDRWGDVASLTSTIESVFGSGLMVNGYYLNNELTDFSLVPTQDGVPVANRIEPGKRPRSSMAPTIVLQGKKPLLALGSPGGSTWTPCGPASCRSRRRPTASRWSRRSSRRERSDSA